MSLARLAINMVVRNPKIESFNRYLFVGPHPDDIEIGAGATVRKLVRMGKQVTFLICTDGRYGKENLDKTVSCEVLADMRREECIKAAAILGVTDVIFLNLCDGNDYQLRDLQQGIAQVINKKKPDIIFAPDPDVNSECHPDHLNVGKVCKELAFFANYSEIFLKYLPQGVEANQDVHVQAIALFMSDRVNKFVTTRGCFDKQKEAILAHSSQYPDGHPATKSLFLYLRLRGIGFGLRHFCGVAEGFRMMNQTRMHCLPESSI